MRELQFQMRARIAVGVWVLALAAVACSDGAGPDDDYVLPPPDSSLDPAALSIGDILYACNRWGASGRPTADRVLADLFFGRRTADDPPDRPSQASLDAVRSSGAQVLFQFAFPAVRVRIGTDQIPPLVDGQIVNDARLVPDPRRYDWDVTIGFRRPIASTDSITFVALGGRVTYMFQLIHAIAGALPNSSIATFRHMRDVQNAEASGIGCRERATRSSRAG